METLVTCSDDQLMDIAEASTPSPIQYFTQVQYFTKFKQESCKVTVATKFALKVG